jgi:hypothetical protein
MNRSAILFIPEQSISYKAELIYCTRLKEEPRQTLDEKVKLQISA